MLDIFNVLGVRIAPAPEDLRLTLLDVNGDDVLHVVGHESFDFDESYREQLAQIAAQALVPTSLDLRDGALRLAHAILPFLQRHGQCSADIDLIGIAGIPAVDADFLAELTGIDVIVCAAPMPETAEEAGHVAVRFLRGEEGAEGSFHKKLG